MTQNPEYKYKYPKFTKSELIKQRLQTEEGTSNKLNTILRAEQSGASIEEIKELDDEYNKGLAMIFSQIDEEAKEISDNLNKLSKETDISEARKIQQKNILKEAEDKLQGQRTKVKMYNKRYNPVLIKPALNQKDYIQKVMSEGNLLNTIENEPVYLNTVRRPEAKSTILQQ
jgi:DNA-binding transcriptional MerR regulator